MGHTYTEIGQALSWAYRRPRAPGDQTVEELHVELFNVYSKDTTDCNTKHVVNFSVPFRKQGRVEPVSGFSHFRFFRLLSKSDRYFPIDLSCWQAPCFDNEHVKKERPTLEARDH